MRTTRGEVTVDLSYGGAIYASVRAADLGLAVTPSHLTDLIAIGREIRVAVNDTEHARHPTRPRLSGVYGTIWYDDLGPTGTGRHQRNCTVFADGEVDRSPCGSGTSARLALLHADGTLPVGATLRHDSVIGTTFEAQVVARDHRGGQAGGRHRGAGQRLPDRRAHRSPSTRTTRSASASCCGDRGQPAVSSLTQARYGGLPAVTGRQRISGTS